MSDIITSKKELAAKLGRHRTYATYMTQKGFKLPCRIDDAIKFLHEHPYPTRMRRNDRG